MLAAPACYLGPIEPPSENLPPELIVIRPDCPPGCSHSLTDERNVYCADCDVPIVFDTEFVSAWVDARDPEDDAVEYDWDILPGVGPVNDAATVDGTTSTIFLEYDPSLDGQTLTVIANDGDKTATMSWLLEVP